MVDTVAVVDRSCGQQYVFYIYVGVQLEVFASKTAIMGSIADVTGDLRFERLGWSQFCGSVQSWRSVSAGERCFRWDRSGSVGGSWHPRLEARLFLVPDFRLCAGCGGGSATQ